MVTWPINVANGNNLVLFCIMQVKKTSLPMPGLCCVTGGWCCHGWEPALALHINPRWGMLLTEHIFAWIISSWGQKNGANAKEGWDGSSRYLDHILQLPQTCQGSLEQVPSPPQPTARGQYCWREMQKATRLSWRLCRVSQNKVLAMRPSELPPLSWGQALTRGPLPGTGCQHFISHCSWNTELEKLFWADGLWICCARPFFSAVSLVLRRLQENIFLYLL